MHIYVYIYIYIYMYIYVWLYIYIDVYVYIVCIYICVWRVLSCSHHAMLSLARVYLHAIILHLSLHRYAASFQHPQDFCRPREQNDRQRTHRARSRLHIMPPEHIWIHTFGWIIKWYHIDNISFNISNRYAIVPAMSVPFDIAAMFEMTLSYVSHKSFMCVAWLVHTSHMTPSHVLYDLQDGIRQCASKLWARSVLLPIYKVFKFGNHKTRGLNARSLFRNLFI